MNFVPEQGDEVEVVVEGKVRVLALAWRMRSLPTGRLVGLMLSEVGPGYEALLARAAAAEAPPAAVAGREAPPAEPPPAPRPSLWWTLRIKQSQGPRTRSVKVAAADREEAVARTLLEVGEGWEILEAQVAAPDRTSAA